MPECIQKTLRVAETIYKAVEMDNKGKKVKVFSLLSEKM
jgi:hypothetical protein